MLFLYHLVPHAPPHTDEFTYENKITLPSAANVEARKPVASVSFPFVAQPFASFLINAALFLIQLRQFVLLHTGLQVASSVCHSVASSLVKIYRNGNQIKDLLAPRIEWDPLFLNSSFLRDSSAETNERLLGRQTQWAMIPAGPAKLSRRNITSS